MGPFGKQMPGNRPGGGGGFSRPHGGPSGPAPLHPKPVKYFSSEGVPDVRLLDEEAEKLAQDLAAKLAPTQLRRFFEDVLVLRRRLEHETINRGESQEVVFQRLLPEFKMLKAKAYYAKKRLKGKFPEQLLQFFVDHTAAVKNAADFGVFCKHFEAVVAFHRYYCKDSN